MCPQMIWSRSGLRLFWSESHSWYLASLLVVASAKMARETPRPLIQGLGVSFCKSRQSIDSRRPDGAHKGGVNPLSKSTYCPPRSARRKAPSLPSLDRPTTLHCGASPGATAVTRSPVSRLVAYLVFAQSHFSILDCWYMTEAQSCSRRPELIQIVSIAPSGQYSSSVG